MDELLTLQATLDKGQNTAATVKLLKLARERSLRVAAPLVAKHGFHVLSKSPGSLGDSLWTVYEQVLIAALDCGDMDAARICFGKLNTQFPKSRRVKRLLGMIWEANGDFARADTLYAGMLAEFPADELVRKRQICVLKAQGKLSEAAAALVKYLAEFQADVMAWKEMADLYIKLNDHAKAKFCVEEVMMAEPQNHAWACLYAEVNYTLGSTEELRIARKYYALALQLKPEDNVRALYGLVATTSAIAAAVGKKSNADPENDKLYKVASTKLLSTYLDTKSPQATQVQQLLADLNPDA